MSNCCPPKEKASCHEEAKSRPDILLWGSVAGVAIFYGLELQPIVDLSVAGPLHTFSASVFELMNTMWWGLTIGIIMVAILTKIPREFVISIFGSGTGFKGIVRATLAGVLLDLCSHGILMVGAKLYERGISAGQLIAFLVASPWNSFSLTLILFALIGLKWTLVFIGLSMMVAVIAGLLFEYFVGRGTLPKNPYTSDLPADFKFWRAAKQGLRSIRLNKQFFATLVVDGVAGSKMVLRWIFFGILLASLVRTFMDAATFQTWFGPSLMGLTLTIVAATIIEVCSEGSTPIAADLVTRAGAPGNSFAFLMAGVATDYTEIMVLKDTAKSWKFALFLPLVTLPQVVIIAWLMNLYSVSG